MLTPPKVSGLVGALLKTPAPKAQIIGKTGFSKILMGKPAAPKTPSQTHHASQETQQAPKDAASKEPKSDPKDELDPTARHAAQLAPPTFAPMAQPPVEAAATVQAKAHVTLEDLIPALVRKIAWAGDGRRGSVRIELGSGELAGGVLVVHADEGKIRVELSVPSGVDADSWRERLERRLEGRGLDVGSVEVR